VNEKLSEKEARFLEKARQSLLASEEQLDAATASRLRDARRKAVEAAGEREGGFFRIPNWARVGGVATAAAAVLVFMIWFDTPKQDLPVKSPDELEIVLNADNMDLYEDLDFYEWLAGAGNGGSSS
jgi:type VI protein secretion system component VasF